MMKFILPACILTLLVACDALTAVQDNRTSDQKQAQQQEKILQEGTSQVGMPAVKNFRERKLLKDIIELRDQTGLTTYTYLWSEMRGEYVFFCESLGYGIPYATQFTSPQKWESVWIGGTTSGHHEPVVVPQADPNGLFSPVSAEGTWVMCVDPGGKHEARPVYVEPRVFTSPFKLSGDKPALTVATQVISK